ncbi:STAS domain-containing protein [Bacteroidota bacterium]
MTANIIFEDRENYSILHIEGDFNGTEENNALLSSFHEISGKGVMKALLDLSKVVYLNSASIGVLLSGNAILKKKGGKIVLFGASDYLDNIFNVTKLNLAFDICKTEEEAIEALK